MDVRSFGKALSRYRLSVAICTLVGLLIGVLSIFVLPSVYTASALVYVSAQSNENPTAAYEGGLLSQERVTSYVQLATSPRVATEVTRQLGLDWTPEEFSSRVSARATTGSVLIEIEADGRSAEQSAAIANATTQSVVNVVGELERPTGRTGPPQVAVRVVQPAIAPVLPSSPGAAIKILAGFIAGIAVGAATAIARFTLDTSVRSSEALAELSGAPSLGSIAYSKKIDSDRMVFRVDAMSPAAESFRRVRTGLRFLNLSGGSASYVITSAVAGEGKSTTALNLAVAASESGLRTVLVEADLRRPKLADYLGLEGGVGLTNILTGTADLSGALQETGVSGLSFVASGQLPPNPSELLGSDRMSSFIRSASGAFDLVILDGPPLLPVTDSAVLSQFVSGAILVCRYGTTSSRQVSEAAQTIRAGGSRLSGSILTLVAQADGGYAGYGGYGSYRSETTDGEGGAQKIERGDVESATGRRRAAASGRSRSQSIEASTDQISRR